MHTLEQIQEYNRKTLKHLSEGENITLSKVLLALGDIAYYEGSLIYLIGFVDYCDGYDIQHNCDWVLTKETLEEQAEDTQRVIFKLLGGDSKCKKYPPKEIPTHKGTRDALEDLCNFNKK